VIVLDGETIYFPHLLGEDYRLHVGMIAAESLTAVSLQAPPTASMGFSGSQKRKRGANPLEEPAPPACRFTSLSVFQDT
jgi:hypothetical protein